MSELIVERQKVLLEELARQKERQTDLALRLDAIEDTLVRLCDAIGIRRPRPSQGDTAA